MIIEFIKHNGRGYQAITPEELRDAGVPEDVIQAELVKLRAASVTQECRRRIYSLASAEAQRNWNFYLSLAAAKTASSRSAEETAILNAGQLALDWINQMRSKIVPLVEDVSIDFKSDDAWPDVPEEVRQTVAMF